MTDNEKRAKALAEEAGWSWFALADEGRLGRNGWRQKALDSAR